MNLFAEIIFEHTPPFPWLVGGLAVAAAVTFLVFLKYLPKRFGEFGILFLRLLFLALLGWCLFMPLEQDSFTEQFRQRFLVVLDKSASMELSPDPQTASRWENSQEFLNLPWVRHLESQFSVGYHMIDSQIVNPDGVADLRRATSDGGGSHIQEALEALRERYRGQDVAGILVMSDGLDTREVDDSWAVGPWGAPLYTLEVESSAVWEKEPDLRVESVLTQRRVLVGWETSLTVIVSGQGAGSAPIPVQLYREIDRGDGPSERVLVQEIPTQIPSDGGRREVVFTLSNEEVGSYNYLIRVPPLPDEKVIEDNQFSISTQVVEAQNRLIYLEGLPRWESRYLSRTLRGNPDFSAVIYIYYNGEFRSLGDTSGVSLALTEEEIAPFSVIILGNFKGEVIGEERARTLLQFVEDGGSLVLLGGPDSWGGEGIFDTPLRPLLPFRESPSATPEVGRFRSLLTREGREHPAFSSRNQQNQFDWTSAPPVLSVFPVQNISQGATTLVEVETTTGKYPLIISLRYGQGRVLALMTDSLYRWQLEPGDARPYLRFWNQILNWLRPTDREQQSETLDLFADADQVFLGDTVQLTVRVPERLMEGTRENAIDLQLRLPDGRLVNLETVRQTIPTGTGQTFTGFVNQFRASEPGLHRAVARARIGEINLESAPFTFFVRAFTAETEPRPANRVVLETLATSSDGRFGNAADLNQFLLQQQGSDREESRLTTHTLWNLTLILSCLIGLLTVECIFRKIRNLV